MLKSEFSSNPVVINISDLTPSYLSKYPSVNLSEAFVRSNCKESLSFSYSFPFSLTLFLFIGLTDIAWKFLGFLLYCM